jgi:hypothetical protein
MSETNEETHWYNANRKSLSLLGIENCVVYMATWTGQLQIYASAV